MALITAGELAALEKDSKQERMDPCSFQGLFERPSVAEVVVATRNGWLFALPVSNRRKHVWSFLWGVRKRLTVSHARWGGNRPAPTCLSPKTRDWPAPGVCL